MNSDKALPSPHQLLPHRYPFLLIDRITDHTSGSLQAVKCVTYNEPYFQGHFPNHAIVPGVLLLEMMAQASAALYRLERGVSAATPPIPGRFAAIEKARFFKEVHPGDKLIIETCLKQRIGGLARFEARILMDSDLIAEGILILVSPLDKLPSQISHLQEHNE